jgi:hypothetical protein
MKMGACFFFFTFNLHLSLLLLVFLFPETGDCCQFILKSALLYLIAWIKNVDTSHCYLPNTKLLYDQYAMIYLYLN